MNGMNVPRCASGAFGMMLVVLLSDIILLTNLYAQTRPKMQIAFVSNRDGNSEIYVIDGHGKNLRNLTNNPNTDRDPAWSPDGREIVFSSFRHGEIGHGKSAIYVMRADGENVRRLTNNPDGAGQPAWSPDNRQIIFSSYRYHAGDSGPQIYVMQADGANVRRLTDHSALDYHPTWSPDGRRIAFQSDRNRLVWLDDDIYVMDTDGKNIRNLTEHPGRDRHPMWSPNGHQIVFASIRVGNFGDGNFDAGNYDIYIMNADGKNIRRLTKDPSDEILPAWSLNGQKIIFSSNRAGNSDIYMINADGTNLRQLTNHPAEDWGPTVTLSVSPVGKRTTVWGTVEASRKINSHQTVTSRSGEFAQFRAI